MRGRFYLAAMRLYILIFIEIIERREYALFGRKNEKIGCFLRKKERGSPM